MTHTIISLIAIATLSSISFADEASLQKQLDSQSEQLFELQKKFESLNDFNRKPSATADSNTTIGGYGEAIYNGYRTNNKRNQMDLRRFVLFFGHRFNEQLTFNSEVEWEHAITSADDAGETALEQAYINYQFSQNLNLKVGLILMPFGFLNLNHEPPVFYGAERNEVERRIIPTTWREGGIGVWGTTEFGVDWDLGVVSSFNAANFDDTSKPLGSMRQKMSNAKAQDLAYYGAVNYRIPSVLIGASLFYGDTTHGNANFVDAASQPDFSGINGTVSLWDVHARWQAMGFDVQGLYAQGEIADAARLDEAIQTYNTANAETRAYLPSMFYGWLGQAAYTFGLSGSHSLSPFARYEVYNSQARMPLGLAAKQASSDRLITVGVSYKPHTQVVFKGDYQKFVTNSVGDRFNLGVGYMF